VKLRLDARVRVHGRTLVGGEPLRVMRLSPAGVQALAALGREAASPAEERLRRRLVEAGLAHPCPAPCPADATIVIPVRDRPAELARCLAAVRGQRVIVVDDGSRVPVPGALRREVPGGPAAARNAALPRVDTDLVAFLDSDCVPPPAWVERLAGHFADPRVGAVAPRVAGLLDLGGRPAEVGPGRRVAYVPAAALVVRRSAVAPFDPALRYGEDVDLVWRLVDAGWRVRYDPRVVVRHDDRHRLIRRFRYGTSAAPLAQRHPTRLAPVVLRPLPTATLALLLARRPRAAGALAILQAALLVRRGVPARDAPALTARALVATARLPHPAYLAGVVSGALTHRTAIPLRPRLR
jgi:mycofactocin glycosyltransferase